MVNVPRYVAYPILAAASYGLLYFIANRSVYFPSKYPEGLWDWQAQLGAADVDPGGEEYRGDAGWRAGGR